MSQAHTPESAQIAAPTWSDAQRQADFNAWLTSLALTHDLFVDSVRVASADASFRRYFRVDSARGSRIIMDAPPTKEDCRPFAKVAQLMHAAHVHAPEVLAWDEAKGFMLLTDLGAQTMMQAIDRDNPQANLGLYLQALDALIAWQIASRPDVLPLYDEALLRRELELFPDWYLARHQGVAVEGDVRRTLDDAFKCIIEHNLAWPSVYVHRDFMPRNLMVTVAPTLVASRATLPPEGAVSPRDGPAAKLAPTPGTGIGVLDFQDAVYGPITYDIASLMRDAFLSWDEDFCLDITIRYWEKARKAGLPVGDDFGEFYRGVEWMGLQRHLKVAGIFARLTLRDGKPQYLADTPRFINYMRATCARYRELKPLLRLIERVEGIEVANGYAFGRV
jgi:aminoglycoside/choline kinase family phosphotransferase